MPVKVKRKFGLERVDDGMGSMDDIDEAMNHTGFVHHRAYAARGARAAPYAGRGAHPAARFTRPALSMLSMSPVSSTPFAT